MLSLKSNLPCVHLVPKNVEVLSICLHNFRNIYRGECSEACKQRRREFENEIKAHRRDSKCKDERLARAELEMQSLIQYKDSQNDNELLLSAISSLRDKNSHLENGLKAETRIKLDLFSALGEAKRQLEIRESKSNANT